MTRRYKEIPFVILATSRIYLLSVGIKNRSSWQKSVFINQINNHKLNYVGEIDVYGFWKFKTNLFDLRQPADENLDLFLIFHVFDANSTFYYNQINITSF